ncbi:MAG TPA: DUF2206 domain-containing protein [Patescibacteria group bacterium]|nr:DUF2206 domain-containing protein [Patescibacteria group bacterium]
MNILSVKEENLLLFSIFLLVIFDSVVLSPASSFLNASIAGFFILFYPGRLLLHLFKIKTDSFWVTTVYSLCLSLVSLLFCGLAANWILPHYGINKPLITPSMLYIVNVFIMSLSSIFYLRKDALSVHISLPKMNARNIALFLFPLLFPLLGVFGAISINNTGNNAFTLVMLFLIGIYSMTFFFHTEKISSSVFPFALFCISLAILLMTSLRGWYITGHDIQEEYYVFQLTKSQFYWNINALKDAYNACLSITILPTVLSDFLRIPDMYIYKVVFQIIFAFCPVIVYLFLERYTQKITAFLSTLYFISFPTFFYDMPMLNRQEIGFLFFSLFLFVVFDSQVRRRTKPLSFFLFVVVLIAGMVVSHYSTTYVAVGLMTLTYIATKLFQFFSIQKIHFMRSILARNTISRQPRQVSIWIIGALILLTFLWNSQITKTSGDLTHVITQSFSSITTILKQDNKSSSTSYSLFSSHHVSEQTIVKQYVQKSMTTAQQQLAGNYYADAGDSVYALTIVPNETLPPTIAGTIIKIPLFSFNYILRQFSAKIIQILIVLGLFGFFLYREKTKYPLAYVIACLVSVFFIFLMIILPEISLSYGLLRLFQQLLILLGLPVVTGSILLFRLLKQKHALFYSGLLLVLFFLTVSGCISEITGGYYPQLNLDNAGLYYDAYYSHKAEIASAQWLHHTIEAKGIVQASELTASKLLIYGNISAVESVIPQTIAKSSYVYLDAANTQGKLIVSMDQSLVVTYPTVFLQEHKNLIYNNGLSRIYH